MQRWKKGTPGIFLYLHQGIIESPAIQCCPVNKAVTKSDVRGIFPESHPNQLFHYDESEKIRLSYRFEYHYFLLSVDHLCVSYVDAIHYPITFIAFCIATQFRNEYK